MWFKRLAVSVGAARAVQPASAVNICVKLWTVLMETKWARGEAPLELAQHLAGATLHALPKGTTDVRPIAVGETLRRLVAKCLCSHVKSEARDWLSPLQVGVAVPLGAEAVVHSSRHWVHANRHDPDKVFLKLDFVNAFNTIDRAALLREVRLRLPAVAAWAEWCYSTAATPDFFFKVMP
jgi:hypothetical protein